MEVPSLTVGRLTPVVRRALGEGDARPTGWTCDPLGVRLANPATAGLFRVAGTATSGAGLERRWRMVLKVVHQVDLTGTPLEEGYLREPGDWNYWKREVLVHRSGLLDAFVGPLRAVRCFAAEEIDDKTAWLWLEELDTSAERAPWSLPELSAAAHDLGAFGAQGVDLTDEVRGQPWAAQQWLRRWLRSVDGLGAGHVMSHVDCFNHPLLRDRLPRAAAESFLALMGAAGPLLDRIELLPSTVAHHDAQWSNLFHEPAPSGARTVAIDWSFLGVAPVGHDLGGHIACSLVNRAVEPQNAAEFEQAGTEAYLAGLRDHGWRGDEGQVRLAALTVAALQMVPFLAMFVAELCPYAGEVENWPEQLAQDQGCSVNEAMDAWCETFLFLLGLGERARGMLSD